MFYANLKSNLKKVNCLNFFFLHGYRFVQHFKKSKLFCQHKIKISNTRGWTNDNIWRSPDKWRKRIWWKNGSFTCPVGGTYMFVVDSISSPEVTLHLNVNKITVGRLRVSYFAKGNTYVQASRTVIVKLKSRDHVSVENVLQNTYIRHYIYSGFSGALLYWRRNKIPDILIILKWN